MSTANPATLPGEVTALVDRFRRNRDEYRSPAYNETQARRELIDPLFKALGWDVDNSLGVAEAYKDVIHEDAIKIGGSTKAPDYCFRIGGTRKFFVEAKKPGIDLKSNPEPAYQLRRYAWTSKLPLSILTDFEEFAVYDCRIKPAAVDKAAAARVFYCTCDDYAAKWPEIAGLFSKDAVLKGAFDRYAESARKKRGTAEVDKAFLEEIEGWRDVLARNIALRNPDLTQRDLNFAVQRTIDRIIFLRICEDRAIEPHGQLLSLVNGDKIYERLCSVFRRADEKYNSGIFHFEREKDRDEAPDTLTPSLAIDDKVLREILKSLYYPDSPYEFSVLPADILGHVYEQFLGKVIRLTAGHRAVVEEKPEVRKAGGVYYTPTYIVDYIVRNTVGRLLGDTEDTAENPDPGSIAAPAVQPIQNPDRKGAGDPRPDRKEGRSSAPDHERGEHRRPGGANRSPELSGAAAQPSPPVTPTDAARLRILDPACGSGSFLIGAYQYLLDWHLRWYTANDPGKWCKSKRPPLVEVAGPGSATYRLTVAERKRILLESIYGVDIDPQAVEVTKLSLLLKVLEGESGEVLSNQWRLLHERALPDLGRNIKCGNSLIGPDFYHNQQMLLLDEDERLRINVFDWNAEFPEIMKAGGFDAVIGNPPYVNAWDLFESSPAVRTYINESRVFATAERHWDLYILFLEKALAVARPDAWFSFIIPFSYAIQKYARASRNQLLTHTEVVSVADFRSVRVFENVPVITIVPVVRKSRPHEDARVRIMRPDENATPRHPGIIRTSHTLLQSRFLQQNEEMLRLDLSDDSIALCSRIAQQSVLLGEFCWVNYGAQMSSRAKGTFGKDHVIRDRKATATCRRTISGRDLYRYSANWAGKYVEWAMADQMYGPRHMSFFESPKLMIRDITGTHRLEVTYDETGLFCDHTILCAQFAHVAAAWRSTTERAVALSSQLDPYYVLGMLASRLVSAIFYLTLTGEGVRIGGGFHTYPKTARQLPVFDMTRASGPTVRLGASVAHNARLILKSVESARTARTEHEQSAIQRQIDAIDRQIDELVYELYGLTDDEIRIVEEATAR